jgi:probable phosphoglycerate mutase
MSEQVWTTLYIVRHGETRWNFEGRWQGWQDSPLTEKGQQQAEKAGQELQGCGAVALFTSDAGRAQQTARIIGQELGLQPQIEQGLRERYYGEYEGMTSAEIDEKFPGTRYEVGRDRRDTWRPIGGESLVEVSARAITTIRQLATSYPGNSLVLITHAGVIRVLDALATHESLEDIWDRVPGNCAIFVLQANPAGDLKIIKHFAPM